MKYKSLIFDLDGTLIITLPQHRYTLVGKVLEELGSKTSNDLIDQFWFESKRDEIVKQDFKVDFKKFWETYEKHDTTDLRNKWAKPYKDTHMIKILKDKGYKIGLVTGAPKHIAELEINMIGKENFDSIVVAHKANGISPKPDPQGIIKCLKELNSKNNESIYVGNADEDILAAKNAKVFDILIDRKEHKFPDIKPSLKINNLYDLERFLS